jgi:hypothetical protein
MLRQSMQAQHIFQYALAGSLFVIVFSYCPRTTHFPQPLSLPDLPSTREGSVASARQLTCFDLAHQREPPSCRSAGQGEIDHDRSSAQFLIETRSGGGSAAR